MYTTTVSKNFEDYWQETERNRSGYPDELIELLKRHERSAFISAVQSAGNNVTIAFYEVEDCQNAKDIAHDTIWSMKK